MNPNFPGKDFSRMNDTATLRIRAIETAQESVPLSRDRNRPVTRLINALVVAVILTGVAILAWFWLPVLPSSVYVAAAFLGALAVLLRVTSKASR